MKVVRKDVFEFIVVFTEDEFNRIKAACDKWDECPEAVIDQIVKAGFDEGCEL